MDDGGQPFVRALVVAAVPLTLLTPDAVGIPAAAAVAAFFGWLGSQVSVEADERGIVVREVLRLRRIPWDDVAGIEIVAVSRRRWFEPYPIGNFHLPAVRRRDGSVVHLSAMPLWDDKRGRRHWGAVERWRARAGRPG